MNKSKIKKLLPELMPGNEQKADGIPSSQTIAKPNVSRSYIILYENNPESVSGAIEKFDGEVMSNEKFNTNKDEGFSRLKDWALKSGKKIFILEAVEPLVKIIPEVNIVTNCG